MHVRGVKGPLKCTREKDGDVETLGGSVYKVGGHKKAKGVRNGEGDWAGPHRMEW